MSRGIVESVIKGLHEGKITRYEAAYFLESHGISLEHAEIIYNGAHPEESLQQDKNLQNEKNRNDADKQEERITEKDDEITENNIEKKNSIEKENDKITEKKTNIKKGRTRPDLKDILDNKRTIAAVLTLFIMVSALSIFIVDPTSFGRVVLETQTTAPDTIPVHQAIDGLWITGTLHGEGEAIFTYMTNDTNYTIAIIKSDDGNPRTDKASYSPGEQVTIINTPIDTTYYLTVNYQPSAVDMPFPAPADEGEYELIAVQNNSNNLSTKNIRVVVSSTPIERTTAFENVCVDTCTIPPSSGIIHIENTTPVTLQRIDATAISLNRPPMLSTQLGAVNVSSTIMIDLSAYFTDPDGDDLMYSTSSSSVAELRVDHNILTITPRFVGEESITVYASDMKELVQDDMMLTITGLDTKNSTNTTMNTTTETNGTTNNDTTTSVNDTTSTNNTTTNNTTNNATNQTIDIPATDVQLANGTTNNTMNTTIDCSDPDPNARPIECLQQNAQQYFPDQDVYWENADRTRVAKFNELGNLLIKGIVITQSTAAPQNGDFVIGITDINNDIVPKIWIDGAGNLHLKGNLYEEQTSIVPPPGSYSIISKRNIYLMYADKSEGDMWLRGNVIPYRREIS